MHGYPRIVYRIVNSDIANKASYLFCSILATFSLFNYGSEPSVSKGIVSQLPSFHLSIHRVLTKLSYRVMPYGDYSCQLQLLLFVVHY